MNYRHSYHAGNFADVLKHGVLCWIVRYLQQKEAPLCLIDTHAGAGAYDLTGPKAEKTGEAKDGVLRLIGRNDVPAPLKSYLDIVRATAPAIYPGSPALLALLARPADRIIAVELHPEEAQELKRSLAGSAGFQPALSSSSVKILTGDGYTTLLKQVPPREKRGLVLIDPPFEEPDEFERLAKSFIAAHRKWPTGVYLLWFPIKHPDDVTRFTAELVNAAIPKLALITLDVARAEGLSATGLILCNAPFTLEAEWRDALSWLKDALAQGQTPSAAFRALTTA